MAARYSISANFAAALRPPGTTIAYSLDLQGHRGARGLAPENSLDGFALALSLGVTTLELDTAVTRDGVVVVAHDRRLNPDITRGPDGIWLKAPTPAVNELSFAELQRYDVGRIDPSTEYARRFPGQQPGDGIRMPRLADVFDLAKRSGNAAVRFNIETKLSPQAPKETPSPARFVEAVLAVVKQAGLVDRVTIQSFDWRTLRIVHSLEPRIATSFLTSQDTLGTKGVSSWTGGLQLGDFASVPELVRAAATDRHGDVYPGSTWSPDFRDLTAESVRQAQSLGLRVLSWTVNEREDIVRMIDWKVDGLITDYPDRVRELMRERGLALP